MIQLLHINLPIGRQFTNIDLLYLLCISNDIENLSLIADVELKYFIRNHNGIHFNIEYQ